MSDDIVDFDMRKWLHHLYCNGLYNRVCSAKYTAELDEEQQGIMELVYLRQQAFTRSGLTVKI